MFNPESFSMTHKNVLEKLRQGINTSGRTARYSHSKSDTLSLDLVFDGTAVSDMGISALLEMGALSVSDQIKGFLEACFYMDGKIHEPKFLKINWGDGPLKDFECRLESVDIDYTSFEKSGTPLRAKLKTKFVEDIDPEKRNKKDRKSSPDLSHSRVVKPGDTLPLLCKEIYGSSGHYLRVAQANDLDDFRNLIPGQQIKFPPVKPDKTPAGPAMDPGFS
jgi:LysM repeat protein